MKHIRKRVLCCILAVLMLSSFTGAFAVQESSDYLDSYTASVTPISGGRLGVTVDVSGVGYQDDIGASQIEIWESSDGIRFTKVATYTPDICPEMLESGTSYYDTPVIHQGTVGYYYFATVTFYAAKNGGYDTAVYDTVTKRAIA